VPIDFNELRELLAAIAQTDIAELTLKSADFELTVRKGVRPASTVDSTLGSPGGIAASEFVTVPPSTSIASTTSTSVPEARPSETEKAPPGAPNHKWEEVKSPMVGTFYRAPSPDEPPYVETGDRIRVGQTVCIIEAMKLMNEIEAEVSGQVVEILVENGDSVEYGQTLMRINPNPG
jgi:acetyl-CoA carboxylase biotin carboxyl carrier protein